MLLDKCCLYSTIQTQDIQSALQGQSRAFQQDIKKCFKYLLNDKNNTRVTDSKEVINRSHVITLIM